MDFNNQQRDDVNIRKQKNTGGGRVADNTCVIVRKCQSEGMLERWNGQPDTQKPEADSGFCVAI